MFPLLSGPENPFLKSPYLPFNSSPVNVLSFQGLFLGLFNDKHCLTSPRILAMRTICFGEDHDWKSAPFQAGYLRFRGPIRTVTVRPSLFPHSFTPCTVPVPCGSDTTDVGCMGLTLLT